MLEALPQHAQRGQACGTGPPLVPPLGHHGSSSPAGQSSTVIQHDDDPTSRLLPASCSAGGGGAGQVRCGGIPQPPLLLLCGAAWCSSLAPARFANPQKARQPASSASAPSATHSTKPQSSKSWALPAFVWLRSPLPRFKTRLLVPVKCLSCTRKGMKSHTNYCAGRAEAIF